MRLKYLLSLFAVGILAIPLASLSIGRIIFDMGTSSPAGMPRALAAYRAAQEAISLDKDGRLQAVEGARIPAWMELIVTDTQGRLVLSTLTQEATQSLPYKPGYRTMTEGFSLNGEYAGLISMRYRTTPLSFSSNPFLPFAIALALLGLAAIAFSLSGIISAGLVSSFRKLEKAAEGIASGDLESQVPAEKRQIREISALAQAMERMRGALAEDRSRRARFLASVSHDLRTPLTSIKGYIEAVEDGLASDPETMGRYLRIMRDKTNILEDRVSELLDFARMGTGEWRLRRIELFLKDFLESKCAAFHEDATAAGKIFSFNLSELEGLRVLADPKMLSRALENIFSNALRYSPAGGTISLEARVSQGKEAVELSIADSGPGIPSAELERIFDPYFRGGQASGEGEGLGLCIARSILRDHGWQIRASSPPGGGARFSISLDCLPQNSLPA